MLLTRTMIPPFAISQYLQCLGSCAGYALDLLSPVYPDHFLLLACLGSLARAVTGRLDVKPLCACIAVAMHFCSGTCTSKAAVQWLTIYC